MPPETQGELLLSRLLAERDTLYLTTIRPESEVHEAIATRGDSVTAVRVTPGDLVEQPEAYLDDIPAGGNVVVDTVDGLERGGHNAYLDFLNRLKQDLAAAGAIGVVRCLTENEAANRRLTLDRADIVWNLPSTSKKELSRRGWASRSSVLAEDSLSPSSLNLPTTSGSIPAAISHNGLYHRTIGPKDNRMGSETTLGRIRQILSKSCDLTPHPTA